jgi:hypothetical protein
VQAGRDAFHVKHHKSLINGDIGLAADIDPRGAVEARLDTFK